MPNRFSISVPSWTDYLCIFCACYGLFIPYFICAMIHSNVVLWNVVKVREMAHSSMHSYLWLGPHLGYGVSVSGWVHNIASISWLKMLESNSTTNLQIEGDVATFVESDSDEVDDYLMSLVLMLIVVMTVWLTLVETFDGTFRCFKVG